MSVSVGSSYSNPYAYLQYLLQQNASSSATAGQTDAAAADPLAQSPSGTAASYSNSTASAMLVNSSAQFGPQTFFALLGMQETGNGSPSEMPWSQPGTGDTSGDNDAASAGQSWGGPPWSGQVQQGPFGPPPFAGIGALLTSADSGATGQTTTNANGSTTYTITYPDGSTVAMTTAASSSASSSASSDAAGGASATSNNPLEQLIQTLTQSLNAASTNQSGDGTSSGTQAGQGQVGPLPFGNAAALQAAANNGATGQTTTNANGSTTYTITYPDSSTVTLTTAPASTTTSSSASSSTADNTSSTSSNPLEQAIEMLAGALSAATSQSAGATSSEQPQSQFAPPTFGAVGNMLASADSGASSQTTTNANGSTTYTITYPDGSTVTLTTPAASSSTSSADGSSSATNTTGTYTNLLERLIEMQAQLLNSTTPSTISTA